MRMNITSAAGVLSLLDETEPQLKVFALEKLNKIVDIFWAEISESIDKIEVLYEETAFKQRELAALVASKVYYHLGSFADSLTYALGAAKCIDHYTKLRVANAESSEEDQKPIDSRLESIVNRMFQRCFDDKQYKQAVGIALETRRIDIFERAILESHRQFRNTVLEVLTKLYMGLATPDYINVCQCYIFLDDAQSVAEVLEKLAKGDETSVLMAYQIAFDMYDSATQQFLTRVLSTLRAAAPVPIIVEKTPVKADKEDNDKDKDTSEGEPEKLLQDRLTKLLTILSGDMTIDLHLQFLIRNNKTDLLILKNT
ncbi:PSMD1-like protein, partial [Mya arenaria]